jgi:hypothetical protein
VLIVIAILRDWGSLDASQGVRWIYLGSMIAGLLLIVALYLRMEIGGRLRSPVAESPA